LGNPGNWARVGPTAPSSKRNDNRYRTATETMTATAGDRTAVAGQEQRDQRQVTGQQLPDRNRDTETVTTTAGDRTAVTEQEQRQCKQQHVRG
jgi:hypothetical protein